MTKQTPEQVRLARYHARLDALWRDRPLCVLGAVLLGVCAWRIIASL